LKMCDTCYATLDHTYLPKNVETETLLFRLEG